VDENENDIQQNNLSTKNTIRSKTGMLEYAAHAFTPAEKIIFWILAGALTMSALALLMGVNADTLVSIPQQGGILTEGIVGTPHFVNPLFATTDSEKDLSALIYSGLMKTNADDKLVPDLAQSYIISPDGRTYTFTLKNNLRFQDGTPITADDVAFTIQKASDPSLKSPRQANWDGVKVTELSQNQIQFTLTQPYAAFLQNTTLGILPKHIWENIDNNEFSQLTDVTGSGPYKVTGIDRDASGVPISYTLTAFDDYINSAPYIKTLVFRFYTDETDALSAYKNGYIQSLSTLSPEDMQTVASTTSSTIVNVPLPRLFGVFFNQSRAPVFTNREVREALAMVVDRQAIISQVLGNYAVPITSPIPTTAFKTIPATTTVAMTSVATTSSVSSVENAVFPAASAINPASVPSINIFGTTTTTLNSEQKAITAAKNLLAKNAWALNQKDGVLEKTVGKTTYKLEFSIYTANTPELEQTADILQQEWQSIGAVVSVKSFELGDLNESILRPRQYDVLLFGEVVDDSTDLYAFWDSSQRNDPGLNVAMYANSKVDKIVEQLRTTIDPATQQQLFQQFLVQFNTDIPAIFIYSPDFIYVLPKTVHNATINQITNPSDRFASINQWYIDTEKIWKIFSDGKN
jgi:peptide/nickel transport system substrate-binding protein